LTGNTELEDKANEIGKAFSSDLIRSGSSITQSMQAIQFIHADPKEITLVTPANEDELIQPVFRDNFDPFSVVHVKHPDNASELSEIASYTKDQELKEGKPTLYVCTNFTCEQPINDLEEMLNTLHQ
jgi:uncharacterized protein YyaL (SSP411 family)